jgi:hypothetical protein
MAAETVAGIGQIFTPCIQIVGVCGAGQQAGNRDADRRDSEPREAAVGGNYFFSFL